MGPPSSCSPSSPGDSFGPCHKRTLIRIFAYSLALTSPPQRTSPPLSRSALSPQRSLSSTWWVLRKSLGDVPFCTPSFYTLCASMKLGDRNLAPVLANCYIYCKVFWRRPWFGFCGRELVHPAHKDSSQPDLWHCRKQWLWSPVSWIMSLCVLRWAKTWGKPGLVAGEIRSMVHTQLSRAIYRKLKSFVLSRSPPITIFSSCHAPSTSHFHFPCGWVLRSRPWWKSECVLGPALQSTKLPFALELQVARRQGGTVTAGWPVCKANATAIVTPREVSKWMSL